MQSIFFPISYSSWNRENPAISPWQQSKHPLERDIIFKYSFHIYSPFYCKGSKLTNAEENLFLFTWPRIAKTLLKDLILWLLHASYLNNLVWGSPHRFLTLIYRLAFSYRAHTCVVTKLSSQNNYLQLFYFDDWRLTVFLEKQWLLHTISPRTLLHTTSHRFHTVIT